MIKAVFQASVALLVVAPVTALAATVQDSFDSVVVRAQRANQTPAQGCDTNSCWRAWRIVNQRRAMLAIARSYNEGGNVNTACWTEPADTAGPMTCMTTRGETFAMSANTAAVWLKRLEQANNPIQGAPAAPPITLDLSCAAPVVTKGDASPGRNPVVAARVKVDRGDWSVAFKFADGSSVERADQYRGGSLSPEQIAKNNVDAKQPAIAQWFGSYMRRDDVFMIGSVYQDGPTAYRYVEIVASTANPGDAKVMVATCAPMRAGEPPATAPANPDAMRDAAMTFSAVANGDCENCVTISAVGKIEMDSDTAFVAAVKEQDARGKRVSSVRLASPGGSVVSALSMGRSIRRLGLKTFVDSGCASACALAFMGGVARHAAPMTLGVHQFTFGEKSNLDGVVTAMASQASVSVLLTYVKEMGIDSEVIALASATLPNEMHYFGATELNALNINTKQ